MQLIELSTDAKVIGCAVLFFLAVVIPFAFSISSKVKF